MPMSATTISPASARPGSNTRPGLRAANVTVRVARTTGPHTVPVRPSTPDGMSTASTSPPKWPSCSTAHAASPSSVPRNPVPYIASTTRSAAASARTHRRRSMPAASSKTLVRTPQLWSTRAATRPSPPLLPLPHTSTTRRPYVPCRARRTVHATARPARSMSTSTGVPEAMARASAAAIASGVTTTSTRASAEREHDRHGGRVGVRERHLPRAHPARLRQRGGRAVQRERGRAAVVVAHHLHIAEREGTQAGTEGLHHRFLGAEAHGQARDRVVVLVGVALLTIGEETGRECSPALQREPEALDLDQVGAEAADPEGRVHLHQCQRSARSYTGTVSRSTRWKVARRESSNDGMVSVSASRSAPYRPWYP